MQANYGNVEDITGELDTQKNVFQMLKEFCDDYLEKGSKPGKYCCPFCESGKHEHKTAAFSIYQNTVAKGGIQDNGVLHFKCFSGACSSGDLPRRTIVEVAAQVAVTNLNFRDEVKDVVEKLGGDKDSIDKYLNDWVVGKRKFIPKQLDEALRKTIAVHYKVHAFDRNFRNRKRVSEANREHLEAEKETREMQYAPYIERECKIDYDDPKSGGMRYILQRGISAETARKMRLAFDPCWTSPDMEVSTAQKENVSITEAKRRLRLRRQGRPNLIIPYYTSKNTITAYAARDISKGTKEDAKYHKIGDRIPLYNYEATMAKNPKSVFIVEGEIDAISIIECGYDAIAIGSNRGREIVSNLQRDKKNPVLIIALDKDKTGLPAGEIARDLLKEAGFNTILSKKLYGDYEDANDALRYNRKDLEQRLQKVHNLAEIMARESEEKTNTNTIQK